jgi:hypothetical protein
MDIIDVLKDIFMAIVIMFITWLARGYYSKYFEQRPRIKLSIKENGNSSGPKNDYSRFEINWHHKLLVSNQSSIDAYELTIFILNGNKIFTNYNSLSNFFNEQTILESNKSIEHRFETKLSIKYLEYKRFCDSLEQYTRPDVVEHFYPENLKNFQALATYKNEKGKKFFTEYRKETNRFYIIKRKRFEKLYDL